MSSAVFILPTRQWGLEEEGLCSETVKTNHLSSFEALVTFIEKIRETAGTEPGGVSGCSHVVCLMSQDTNCCFF